MAAALFLLAPSTGMASISAQRLGSELRRRRGPQKLCIAVLIIIAAVTAAAISWLFSSLPQTSGTLVVSGVRASTQVLRQSYGIPTIHANTEHDAAFALGFVHAQDRLFQMDLRRRLGSGRLSEILGKDTVNTDRWMRTLGLYREATASMPFHSNEFLELLTAYSAGINAFLDSHDGALPPEFAFLGYTPERWQPADTLVVGKLFQLQLTGNFQRELLRARVATKVPSDALRQLFPEYPDGGVTLSELSGIYHALPIDALLQTIPEVVGPTYASNNWVVDGRRTNTGKPLLANDPHLEFSTPGPWYLCRIETPGRSTAGASIPGIPLVVLGRNQRIAWGFTTTNGDVQDIFIEKVDPIDPHRYLVPGGSRSFEARTETISIHNAAPITMTVRSTHHGPVISDALTGSAASITSPGHVLALATTFLTAQDRSMEAIWALGKAEHWLAFTEALKLFRAPQQNMVYADVDGNIGFYAPGEIPIRRSGDGTLPMPGWTGQFDWAGSIPFDQLPNGFNPPSGGFISANNKVVPDSYPYLITHDWAPPFRAHRIKNLLEAVPKHSPNSFAQIMSDDFSSSAEALVPLLRLVPDRNEITRAAKELLAKWDFRMRYDRPEPLIFSAWLKELNKRVLSEALGDLVSSYQGIRPVEITNLLRRVNASCESASGLHGLCGAELSDALEVVLRELSSQYGSDMALWRWGNAHRARFHHSIIGRGNAVRDLATPSIATSGGNDTINPGSSRLADSEGYFLHINGASFRAIYDLADLNASMFMMAPGQSGNLLSSNFRNLLKKWRDFHWLTIYPDPSAARLDLQPAR